MYQKWNIVAWRLMALLSVLTIGMSLFATSALACPINNQNSSMTVKIFRPDYSKVGSVFVGVKTAAGPQPGACIRLPTQNVLVNTGFDQMANTDDIEIESFPDAFCTRGLGFPVAAQTYQGKIGNLPDCENDTSGLCKMFKTPYQA